MQNKEKPNWNYLEELPAFYADWQNVRRRVVRRIIPRSKLKNKAAGILWKPYLDLAIVYDCLLRQCGPENRSVSICILSDHLRGWHVDLEELDRAADAAMLTLCPPSFVSLKDLLEELTGTSLPEEAESPGLHVLTNTDRCRGAVYMADDQMLEAIGMRLKDDFYVLPSSIHECMIIPVSQTADVSLLQRMVHEINETEVAPDEVLSDSVYLYERNKKRLCIAAVGVIQDESYTSDCKLHQSV